MKASQTPCVGLCSTVYGDRTCRGCFRSLEEITNWTTYSENEKHHTWMRLENVVCTVLPEWIRIHDAEKLKLALSEKRIRFPVDYSPYMWAWRYLVSFQQDIELEVLDNAGITLLKNKASILDFIKALHQTLFIFSDAQIERQQQALFK
ncbi:MAG: DUF1289 domain-containing protein [Pseudomonadota bacterium]